MAVDTQENFRMEYQELAKLMHVFFDWRHKILARFMLMVGAVLLSAQWLVTNSLQNYVAVPLFIGAGASVLALFMDRVNQRIIRMCYESGESLEQKIFGRAEGHMFTRMNELFNARNVVWYGTYSTLLRFTYALVGVLFALSALFSLLHPLF